jgi:hypothetical protein
VIKAGAAIDQGTREGNQFNRQFVDLQNVLAAIPLLNGTLVENLVVTNGTVAVGHGLGRTPRGYIVVKRSADVRVWDASTAATVNLLHLQANGTATVSLWVF